MKSQEAVCPSSGGGRGMKRVKDSVNRFCRQRGVVEYRLETDLYLSIIRKSILKSTHRCNLYFFQ